MGNGHNLENVTDQGKPHSAYVRYTRLPDQSVRFEGVEGTEVNISIEMMQELFLFAASWLKYTAASRIESAMRQQYMTKHGITDGDDIGKKPDLTVIKSPPLVVPQ